VESQIKFHGLDPAKELIKVAPPEGESIVPLNTILHVIEKEGHNISLVLFSGVHYHTGQFFKMKKITEAAHKKVSEDFFLYISCILIFLI
jgi:kynureninase